MASTARVSVVIPARNCERTLGATLDALTSQGPAPMEVIVVDDGSSDRTRAVADARGVRVVATGGDGLAGGARNRGWDAACGDWVCFLDADAVPGACFMAGLLRAIAEFPGCLVGCALRFCPHTPWGWVSHLQWETPYLEHGPPRRASHVVSYCVAVPRDAPLRWDESYGGEDMVFCEQARQAGMGIVFDPRFHVLHDPGRTTFAEVRRLQRRQVYCLVRGRQALQRDGLRRLFARLPVHYVLLLRLPLIYRRVAGEPRLRAGFLAQLPRLVLAEWTLGVSALRAALAGARGADDGGRRFRP